MPPTLYPVVSNEKRWESRFHVALEVDLKSTSACSQSQAFSLHHHAQDACHRYRELIRLHLIPDLNLPAGPQDPQPPDAGKQSSFTLTGTDLAAPATLRRSV